MEYSDVMPPTNYVGWLYVLTNAAMPGLLKIGYTTKTVEQRVQDLSYHTGVPSPFTCVYRGRVPYPAGFEAQVHQLLSEQSFAKEFFRLELTVAIDAIRKVADMRQVAVQDEWASAKYLPPPTAAPPPLLAGPNSRTRPPFVARPPAVARPPQIPEGPPPTETQKTLEIAERGQASQSMHWVPLKGHRHQR
jgi:hypothetical protein